MEFAAWLSEQARRRNWKERDLGRAAGVSQQTASRWLNGRSQPSRAHLVTLAEALEVSVEEVLARCHPLPEPAGARTPAARAAAAAEG